MVQVTSNNRVRGEINFVNPFNAIGAATPPTRKNNFLFFRNHDLLRASRLVERGVARDRHDTWGGDAMDVWLA